MNLPALTASAIATTQPTPTVTTSGADTWTVHLGPVKAAISYLHDAYEDGIDWSVVYVDSDLAENVDPQLAALAAQERNLGDDRWLERGFDANVDGLYDRLNERIATVYTMIAVAVLPHLTAALDDNGERMLNGIEFDAYAGCTTCKCSPGVKAPRARRYGAFVTIDISAA